MLQRDQKHDEMKIFGDEKMAIIDEQEFIVKISPIKFTVEKDGTEYEFEPIGEVTDLVKLKHDIIDIMRRFKITIKSKNIVVIQKSTAEIRESFEDSYLKAKEVIREWYKDSPEKEWSANELMTAAKFEKVKRSSIMNKLIKEKFIKCINPEGPRNYRRYIKAEAMVSPEAVEKQDMKKLEEERRLVRDVLG